MALSWNDIINSNIYLIVFGLFILMTFVSSSFILRFINWFLTIRKLQITLFIVLVLMIFLVTNTFYKFIPIPINLVAPLMIAMSAILASVVAMINMYKSSIERAIDKRDEMIGVIHNAIIRIELFNSKSNTYKKIFLGEEPMSRDMLNLYELLLIDILSLLATQDINKYMDSDKSKLLYKVHENIFLLLTIHRTTVEMLDNESVKVIKYKVFDTERLQNYNETINNLSKLSKLFINIRKIELEKYDFIINEI